MRITPNGIKLNGDAMVMDSLWTSQISSKRPLVVESSYNITLTARDTQGRLANRLVLGILYLKFNLELAFYSKLSYTQCSV